MCIKIALRYLNKHLHKRIRKQMISPAQKIKEISKCLFKCKMPLFVAWVYPNSQILQKFLSPLQVHQITEVHCQVPLSISQKYDQDDSLTISSHKACSLVNNI